MNDKFFKLHVSARIKNYEWYEKENMIYKLRRQIIRYLVTAFLIHYCFAIGFYKIIKSEGVTSTKINYQLI